MLEQIKKLLEGLPKDVTKDPRAIAAYLGEDYANTRN